MPEWLHALRHDVSYALRQIRRARGLSATVVLVLALAIAGGATMFGVIDRLLFRPPPYLQDAANVGRVYVSQTFRGTRRARTDFGYPGYRDMASFTTSFSHVAAFGSSELVFGTGTDAERRSVAVVSASFWPLFGVRPALGRFFAADEDRLPAGAPVAVLGYGHWQTRRGVRADVLGSAIRIGSRVDGGRGRPPRFHRDGGTSAGCVPSADFGRRRHRRTRVRLAVLHDLDRADRAPSGRRDARASDRRSGGGVPEEHGGIA